MLRFVKGLLIVLITSFTAYGQPANDACNNRIELCPNQIFTGSNVNASATVCPDCEDDFSFCFTGTNSVWYGFTTNMIGGTVNIDFGNLNFNIQANRGNQLQACILQATVPCDASTFVLMSNCISNATTNFTLTAAGLLPNTFYYLVINGAKNGGATFSAEASFDIIASGPGIDRLPLGISIGGPSGTICPNKPQDFTAYLANCQDTSSFYWTVNDTLRAITITSLWQTAQLKTGDVIKVTCSCYNVCPDTLTATFGPITVDNLWVNAGPDVAIESGQSIILTGSSNGLIYFWTPINGLSNPNSNSTVASPETTTTYALTAQNTNCSLTDYLIITVLDRLVIPGSFSPNGDGVNDTWVIDGIANYPNATVKIYDRWGQSIADIPGYSKEKAWDGTNKGKSISDGVYFYALNLDGSGEENILKGSITVIR